MEENFEESNKIKMDIPLIIKNFYKDLLHFPDGRIDFSNSFLATAINIVIKSKDSILILKRSDDVSIAKGKWAFVAGHYDELKTIKEKALEEIYEETGIVKDNIRSINIGKEYEYLDNSINRKWIIFPVLVELFEKYPVKLDWEHTDYSWIKPEKLKEFDVPESVTIIFKYFFKNPS